MRSVRIVLDEEKILREGKYKLDELYAYLDEIAQKSRLTKQDKFTYLSSGDENDLGRVALFLVVGQPFFCCYVIHVIRVGRFAAIESKLGILAGICRNHMCFQFLFG